MFYIYLAVFFEMKTYVDDYPRVILRRDWESVNFYNASVDREHDNFIEFKGDESWSIIPPGLGSSGSVIVAANCLLASRVDGRLAASTQALSTQQLPSPPNAWGRIMIR
jgi:hypothetical protein